MWSLFLDLPECASGAGRPLDELARHRVLRLEQGSERRFLSPRSRFFLQAQRILGSLLTILDIPGGCLLRAFDAEARLAQLAESVKQSFPSFLFRHCTSSSKLPLGRFFARSFPASHPV